MNTIETIMNRKSVRNFLEKDVSDGDIKTILKAGMAGPSSVNSRDWQFIVIKDKDTLAKMAEGNGKSADPLKEANFAILVCGDLERAFEPAQDFWIIDCAIACQNMVLAATELGIGSVYLGTWPFKNKVKAQADIFGLDMDEVVPHSVIAFGYEKDSGEDNSRSKPEFEESQVHYEKF